MSGALKHLENQASAAAVARQTQGWLQQSLFQCSVDRLPAGIEYRAASTAMHVKYCEVDKAMRGLQPYHPLSLTFYEPTNHCERYRFLRDLMVSVPIALLKITVGGAFGVMVWAMKRDQDMIAIGDIEEIEAARALVMPVVPRVQYTPHEVPHTSALCVLFLSESGLLADTWQGPTTSIQG